MILADLALARRLERAEAANGIACARAGSVPGAAVQAMAGGWAIFAGVNSMLTRTLALGMHGPVSAAEIDRLEHFFHSRGAAVTADLCPYAHPTLIEILCARRYAVTEFNSVLVRVLGGIQPYPPDARVHECGAVDRDLWARTVGASFFERAGLSEEETAAGATLFHLPGARCFLARAASGEPAAGAAMSLHNGLALLMADGTLPAFRNAGLHAALIRARLNAAIAAGCNLATAATLPGSVSQRNYERQGFQVAYTRVSLTLKAA